MSCCGFEHDLVLLFPIYLIKLNRLISKGCKLVGCVNFLMMMLLARIVDANDEWIIELESEIDRFMKALM